MLWLKEWGGLIAAMVSGFWTIVSVFAAYHLRVDAKEKKDTIDLIQRLSTNLDTVRTALTSFKEDIARENRNLAVELKQVAERAEGSRDNLTRLEGRIDNQQTTIHTFTEKIVTVSGQLSAVFRVIDARARASDT